MPAEHVEANHKQKREALRSLFFVLVGLGRRIRIGVTVFRTVGSARDSFSASLS